MTDFESTYLEEFDSLEENYNEAFTIHPLIFENARALIRDKCEYIDLDEIESINADLLKEFSPTMDDEMDIEIEETPAKIQNLTLCVIIDYIDDAHAVENIQGNSTTNLR
ncbi:11528_t:CDS:2, partial [Scutellospora calospora]